MALGAFLAPVVWHPAALCSLISSLAVSKASAVEGNCRSSSWVFLAGESNGTRLNGLLPGAGVDGTAAKGTALE